MRDWFEAGPRPPNQTHPIQVSQSTAAFPFSRRTGSVPPGLKPDDRFAFLIRPGLVIPSPQITGDKTRFWSILTELANRHVRVLLVRGPKDPGRIHVPGRIYVPGQLAPLDSSAFNGLILPISRQMSRLRILLGPALGGSWSPILSGSLEYSYGRMRLFVISPMDLALVSPHRSGVGPRGWQIPGTKVGVGANNSLTRCLPRAAPHSADGEEEADLENWGILPTRQQSKGITWERYRLFFARFVGGIVGRNMGFSVSQCQEVHTRYASIHPSTRDPACATVKSLFLAFIRRAISLLESHDSSSMHQSCYRCCCCCCYHTRWLASPGFGVPGNKRIQ